MSRSPFISGARRCSYAGDVDVWTARLDRIAGVTASVMQEEPLTVTWNNMGAKRKGAGVLAGMHPALFTGVCVLSAIGGGVFALVIDGALDGAYGRPAISRRRFSS